MLNIWIQLYEVCGLKFCRHGAESLKLYYRVSGIMTSFDEEW
jgi:hypothetical protein